MFVCLLSARFNSLRQQNRTQHKLQTAQISPLLKRQERNQPQTLGAEITALSFKRMHGKTFAKQTAGLGRWGQKSLLLNMHRKDMGHIMHIPLANLTLIHFRKCPTPFKNKSVRFKGFFPKKASFNSTSLTLI